MSRSTTAVEVGSGWSKFQVLAKRAVLGAFGVIAKKHAAQNPIRSAIGIVIKLLQMISFVLASHAGLHWLPTIGPLRTVSGLTTVAGYLDLFSSSVYLAFFYLSLIYVAVFVSLFGWAITCFVRNNWPVLWPLKVLRAMGGLSATTLFIPLLYLLMSGFNCGDGEFVSQFWVGYECFTGGHLVQVALVTVLITAFVTLAGMFTLLVFDAHPFSLSPVAKAHGRADFVFLVCKVVLVAVIDVWPLILGRWAVCAAAVLGGILWAAAHIAFLPMYHHYMNRMQVAVTFVYTWAALSLVLSEAYPGYDAAVALYLGAPLAALAGVATADLRARRLFRASPASLITMYEVEIHARLVLHNALWGHPTEEAGDLAQRLAVLDGDGSGPAGRPRFLSDASAGSGTGSAADASHSALGRPRSSGTEASRAAAPSTAAGAPDDSDAQALLALRILSPTDIANIESLYVAGCARFRNHPMLHVFAARYYHVIAQNKHLQMSHLLRAARQHPALDVSFLIFMAHQEAEAVASSSSLSALARISFDKHLGDARKFVARAMRAQVAFWAALQQPVPSLTDMRSVCTGMTASISAAEGAFVELLAISAESLVVLRLYGEFSMFLENDLTKANFLFQEADRIEEQRNAEQQRESGAVVRIMERSKLDIMTETAAVIVADASASSLGVIRSVNAAAIKLFGHSRWQMERRNLSMLMPSPFAELHDAFMRRYLITGTSAVVDYTRVLFGLHRNGTIFTMLIAVRESAASDGAVSVIGTMRSLATTEHHVVLDASFRVTACTSESCALLGMLPAEISARKPLFESWVCEWCAILPDLLSDAGSMIFVRRAQSSEAATADAGCGVNAGLWVQGHLQKMILPGGHVTYVLHWHRMSSDAYTVGKAEERRRMSLSRAASTLGMTSALPIITVSEPGAAFHSDIAAIVNDPQVAVPSAAGGIAVDATHLPVVAPTRASPITVASRAVTAAASSPTAGRESFCLDPSPSQRRLSVSTRGSAALLSVTAKDVSLKFGVSKKSSKGFLGSSTHGGVRTSAGDDRSSAASSVVNGGRLQRRVREILRSDGKTALLPGLVVLRLVGIFIGVIAAAMAISMTAFACVALDSLYGRLSNAAAASAALDNLVEINLQIDALVFCSSGSDPCPLSRETALRSELLAFASDFGKLHRGLYAAVAAAGLLGSYDGVVVSVTSYDLDAGSGAIVVRPGLSSLYAAGVALQTAAEDVAATPIENITRSLPAAAFVLNNSLVGLGVHAALNATLGSWLAAGEASSAASLSILTAMFGAMVAAVASLTLFIVTPILASVNRARDHFLLPFLELPDELTTQLRAQAQKRLGIVEGSEAADGSANAADDSALSVHSDASADEADGGGDVAAIARDVDDEGNIDWAALAQRVVHLRGTHGAVGLTGSASTKRHHRAWAPLFSLAAHFVLPLLCLIPAFAIIYATSVSVLAVVGALAQTTIAAELLAGEVTQTFLVVEGTIAGGVHVLGDAPSPSVDWLVDHCMLALSSLEYHRRLLFFGAPTATLVKASGAGTSGASNTIEHGAFVDGCSFLGAQGEWDSLPSLGNPPPSFDADACRTISKGVVARGLSGAIDALLADARSLCAARGLANAASVASHGGDGTSYSVPDVLAGAAVGALYNLTRGYLTPATNGLAAMYARETYAQVIGQKLLLIAFTCAALGAFTAFMLFAWLPAVVRVGTETKQQRSLLLLVPAPLLLYVGGLNCAARAIVDASSSGSGPGIATPMRATRMTDGLR